MDKIVSNGNIVLNEDQKREMIEKTAEKFKEIFRIWEMDVDNDQQIQDTPHRVAKMYVNELFSGNYSAEPKITVFENKKEYDEMVLLGPITVKSVCSHHLAPFFGEAYIAYIPDKHVVGISKLARITRWFMRRPQIQEELTKQIADYIEEKLQPKGCAVYIKAQHTCMTMRGVEEHSSQMKTSDLRGFFKELPETRKEFFDLVNGR